MKRGFTLIELLVVIAIIAILAAILFPVFGKAREKARQTHCTNNQKSFATAVQIYTQEHEEKLPPIPTFWGDIRVDKAALKCMTMPSQQNGYVYNGQWAGKGLGEMVIGSTVLSADTVWLTSDGMVVNYQVATSKSHHDLRHNDKLIASYMDGHVDMVNQAGVDKWYTLANSTKLADLNPNQYEGVKITVSADDLCTWTVSPMTGITIDPSGIAAIGCDITFGPGSGSAAGNLVTITATPAGGGTPVSKVVTVKTMQTRTVDVEAIGGTANWDTSGAWESYDLATNWKDPSVFTPNLANLSSLAASGTQLLSWAHWGTGTTKKKTDSYDQFSDLTGVGIDATPGSLTHWAAATIPGVTGTTQQAMQISAAAGKKFTFTVTVGDNEAKTLYVYFTSYHTQVKVTATLPNNVKDSVDSAAEATALLWNFNGSYNNGDTKAVRLPIHFRGQPKDMLTVEIENPSCSSDGSVRLPFAVLTNAP